jgi:arginase family enzyme
MLDEGVRKLWLEAEERPEYHIAGDPMGTWAKPRIYSDVPSFMEVPIGYNPEDLEGADAVIIGLPWEGVQQIDSTSFAETGPRPPDPDAVVARSGAYKAPAYLRQYSVHSALAISGGYYPEVALDFQLANHLKIMDYRDVEVKMWDVEETTRRAVERIGHIVQAGATPLVIGGDHSIPYPVVKAISDNSPGKIGVINFDSHYDLSLGGRLNAGNAFGKIMEDCQAEPQNLVIVGISGGAYNTPAMHQLALDLGVTVFTIGDVETMGIQEVVQRAVEAAGRDTDKIYVSVDADAIDPITFPAQKYPEPFGITARQARAALRYISREANLCGFDLVCVGPDYDHKGMGALIACKFYVEVLQGLALRKKERAS